MATEQELAKVRGRLLGLVPEERIRAVDVVRPDPAVCAGFLELEDLSSTVADVLDELGVGGAIAGSVLAPRLGETRICGPAITIRYARSGGSVGAALGRGQRARLGDRDLYSIGEPGDIAVFDCPEAPLVSVMGGLSARWARRVGLGGCIVDGGVRDIEAIRGQRIPVWSRGVTPVTGKHRLEAVELNGPVAIAGLLVQPGDLVAADETGVCIVPGAFAEEVLARCRAATEAERALIAGIEQGASPEELTRILRADRW